MRPEDATSTEETKWKWACYLHLQKRRGDVTPIRYTTSTFLWYTYLLCYPSYDRHIYNVILCRIIIYCALLYYTIPYSTMISYIILYSTLLCYALLFSTMLQLSRGKRGCKPHLKRYKGSGHVTSTCKRKVGMSLPLQKRSLYVIPTGTQPPLSYVIN